MKRTTVLCGILVNVLASTTLAEIQPPSIVARGAHPGPLHVNQPGFFPGFRYPTGNDCNAVTVADFDRDGFADIAAANRDDHTVSVLRNLGDGTFDRRVNYPVGNTPERIVSADFDMDGYADLVTTNSLPGTVSVLRGRADGTFEPRQDIGAGDSARVVSVVDLNGDDVPDLVVIGDDLVVLLGNGDASFTSSPPIPFPTYARASTAGDFDGDGDQDIAVATGTDNSIQFYTNDGAGLLTAGVRRPMGRTTSGVMATDFDHDLDLDLVVGTESSVVVLLNDGEGAFSAGPTTQIGKTVQDMEVADLNRDGRSDLVLGTIGHIVLVIRAADGSWGVPILHPTVQTMTAFSCTDVDRDGDVDIAFAAYKGVSVLENLGRGDFYARRELVATADLEVGAAIGDLDGDGTIDLALARGAISFRWGTADGFFEDFLDGFGGPYLKSVAVGDIDGDGDLDVVTGGSHNDFFSVPAVVRVLRNDGNRQFAVLGSLALPPNGDNQVALSDLDGDGDPDLVRASSLTTIGIVSSLGVRMNSGDGTFGPETSFAYGTQIVDLAVADMNLDGSPDVLVCDASENSVTVFLNDGGGALLPLEAFYADIMPRSLAVERIDPDAYPDVVVVTSSSSNRMAVLLNDGTGGLLDAFTVPTVATPVHAAIGDVDGDGMNDVFVVSAYNGGSLHLGRGDGRFLPRTEYAAVNDGLLAMFADLDRDTDLDLVIPSGPSVLLNNRLRPAYPRCPADVDGDAYVDAADFVVLASNFGAAVPPGTLGDLNGDGVVNTADFVILAADFGCGSE
jgi:hypothetical protein